MFNATLAFIYRFLRVVLEFGHRRRFWDDLSEGRSKEPLGVFFNGFFFFSNARHNGKPSFSNFSRRIFAGSSSWVDEFLFNVASDCIIVLWGQGQAF